MTSSSVLELVRFDTSSSVDTNATAPNLPGPGRNIGLLFDWLGSGLENAINGRPEERAVTVAQDDHQIDSSGTSSSISSNATAPNLPGPGRTIGLLFDWIGAGLERVLRSRALKLGYDPDAVASDIRQLCRHGERPFEERLKFPQLGLTNVEKKRLKKLCKKLGGCARYVAWVLDEVSLLTKLKIKSPVDSTQGFGRDNEPRN